MAPVAHDRRRGLHPLLVFHGRYIAHGRLGNDVEPGDGVGGVHQVLDPRGVYGRLPAAVESVRHIRARMHPDRSPRVIDAGTVLPGEWERLATPQFRADHDLQVREQPIVEIDFQHPFI